MITLKGKYNTADALVSNIADIESSCIDQIKNILNSAYSKDSNIAIMPDTHAGSRKMSRSSAKENISLQQFRDSMKNVYSSSIALSTIDESPMAYKNPEQIIENLGEVCSIDKVIKPVYNIKAK